MTTPENPYAPPESLPARYVTPRLRRLAYVLAALAATHMLAVLASHHRYASLARGAAVSDVNWMTSVLSFLCLYGGATILARGHARGRMLFVVAVGGLTMSLRAWWPYSEAAMLVISAIGLAAGGALLAHFSRQQLRDAGLR
ncbi:hypothetical protein LXA47_00685 [Massilia sp. P8910]|uniref:hypothetical protein n=1 Tax=Massilia antarctica TaxID=2765360 RepID=UPI001E2FE17C|nr:hypothetical protein [Massilia antarctica]MCE3602128.1 hypothetical protein [Massilia antarctica]